MIRKKIGSKELIIIDKNQFFEKLVKLENLNLKPQSILISQWSNKELNYVELAKIVTDLIKKGTKTFVCVGDLSENIHDYIDWLRVDISLATKSKNERKQLEDIITIWNTDNTVEDSIFFFIQATLFASSDDTAILLAILDMKNPKDLEVKECLLNFN